MNTDYNNYWKIQNIINNLKINKYFDISTEKDIQIYYEYMKGKIADYNEQNHINNKTNA